VLGASLFFCFAFDFDFRDFSGVDFLSPSVHGFIVRWDFFRFFRLLLFLQHLGRWDRFFRTRPRFARREWPLSCTAFILRSQGLAFLLFVRRAVLAADFALLLFGDWYFCRCFLFLTSILYFFILLSSGPEGPFLAPRFAVFFFASRLFFLFFFFFLLFFSVSGVS